jgi:glycosyltransferase involved in cell wall biosynthesis
VSDAPVDTVREPRALPLVSIGMPLWNASGAYLREAMASLLSQDYPHLELILSDNGSTDDTPDVCREYAASDSRIRFHRADRNMGAIWNFNHVFRLATGEYFMWAAFDDLRDPAYVRKCVEALERHPEAVLCCTKVRYIDEEGEEIMEYHDPRDYPLQGVSRAERVRALAHGGYWYNVYCLMRRGALERTRLFRPVWGPDLVLTLELCLLGEVIELAEPLFSYRVFREKKSEAVAETLGSQTEATAKVKVDWTGMVREMVKTIWEGPMPAGERLALCAQFLWDLMVRNPASKYNLYADVMAKTGEARRLRQYGRLFYLTPMAGAFWLLGKGAKVARPELRKPPGPDA